MKIAVALIHIFFATIWLGSSFFYAVILLPVIDRADQWVLTRSLRAVMTPLLALSALATIVSGLVMMVQLHGLHPGSFAHTRWGSSLEIGALASVAALGLAFVGESRSRRHEAAGSAAQPGRSEAFARGEHLLRLTALALLLAALATMAVARYS